LIYFELHSSYIDFLERKILRKPYETKKLNNKITQD